MYEIYLIGLAILIGGIIINVFANFIKLTTWYLFLEKVNKYGLIRTLKKESFISIIFLFIIYPLLLGLIGYYFGGLL